jgi:hypothetical protein
MKRNKIKQVIREHIETDFAGQEELKQAIEDRWLEEAYLEEGMLQAVKIALKVAVAAMGAVATLTVFPVPVAFIVGVVGAAYAVSSTPNPKKEKFGDMLKELMSAVKQRDSIYMKIAKIEDEGKQKSFAASQKDRIEELTEQQKNIAGGLKGMFAQVEKFYSKETVTKLRATLMAAGKGEMTFIQQ